MLALEPTFQMDFMTDSFNISRDSGSRTQFESKPKYL